MARTIRCSVLSVVAGGHEGQGRGWREVGEDQKKPRRHLGDGVGVSGERGIFCRPVRL